MKFDDINEVKRRKNSKNAGIIIVALIIVVILIIILISSLIPKEETASTPTITVDSRISRTLYKKVHAFDNDPFWMYSDEDTKIVPDMKETTKMILVYNNLKKSDFRELNCNKIPSSETYENYKCPGTTTLMVDKSVVDDVYRDLFGSNSSSSSSLMKVDSEKNEVYIYLKDLDAYVLYTKEKPTQKEIKKIYKYEFIKTIVVDDKLLLYEVVTEKDLETKKLSRNRYVYTFKLDNDGLYNYYSFEKDA